MSSYRQILYHIVFRTKSGKRVLPPAFTELYAYMTGIVSNKKGFSYQINGMEDHIHMLVDLHPSIALADFMRDLKASTSLWIKEKRTCPFFEGWAYGYAGLTCGWPDKDRIVNYIISQQEHHRKELFADEYRKLLEENGIVIDERYFLD